MKELSSRAVRLLVATDNTFYQADAGIWDAFCFDRAFFDDYRAVFEEVTVAARVRRSRPPMGAHRADGDGVSFVPLTDVHGARWALAPMPVYCSRLQDAVQSADAICVRMPAISGVFASRVARRLGKPVMFELVGDPLSLSPFGWQGKLLGRYLAVATRRVIRQSVAGSYVSFHHLQRSYPAPIETPTDSVSSIRLPAGEIAAPRRYAVPPTPLRLVLVASLFPYKNHSLLLRAMALARQDGIPLMLDLVGDGPLRASLQALTIQLGIGEAVTFHGHVAGRQHVHRILDGSHLFVMPSLAEGLPRSMIEAMARGLPCVGAQIPAIAELLPPDQRFRTEAASSLAMMLRRAQTEPSLLSEWADRSSAIVQAFRQEVLSARRRRLLSLLRGRVRS